MLISILNQVILNIGEIDCREGILLSVERDYYVNFEEAVTHTINSFLPMLKELVAVYKFTVSSIQIIVVLVIAGVVEW